MVGGKDPKSKTKNISLRYCSHFQGIIINHDLSLISFKQRYQPSKSTMASRQSLPAICIPPATTISGNASHFLSQRMSKLPSVAIAELPVSQRCSLVQVICVFGRRRAPCLVSFPFIFDQNQHPFHRSS